MNIHKSGFSNPKLESKDFSCQTHFDKISNMRTILKNSCSHCLFQPKSTRKSYTDLKQSLGNAVLKRGYNYSDKQSDEVMILTQLEEKVIDTFLNKNIAKPKAKTKNKNIQLPFIIEEPKHYSKSNSKHIIAKESRQSMTSVTYTQKIIRDHKTTNANQESYCKNTTFLLQKQNENNKNRNTNNSKNDKLNNERDSVIYRGFTFHNDVVKDKIAKGLLHSTRVNHAKSTTNRNSYFINFGQLLYI